MSDDSPVYPDDLEMGQTVAFDGNEYEVVDTGPGEAMIERTDDTGIRAEVFRWAFTDAVGIELEAQFEQNEFASMVCGGADE
jgi:hypothetical protein